MLSLLVMFLSIPAFASEVRVQLFGHPCLLSGSPSENTLKANHSVSSELLPDINNQKTILELKEKLTSIKDWPQPLTLYRDSVIRHLDAQLAFWTGLELARKESSIEPLKKSVDPFLGEGGKNSFQPAIEPLKTKLRSAEAVRKAFESYKKLLTEPWSENFHRGIRAARIQYNCDFDVHKSEEGT